MAFWNRQKSGVTDDQRLAVLELATDEDYSLDEVVRRLGDLQTARVTVEDLRNRGMLEFYWKRPKGDRELIPHDTVDQVLYEDTEWVRKKSFVESYVIVVANDKGWRWHQDRWRAGS